MILDHDKLTKLTTIAVLGLEAHTTMPGSFTWVLGIEIMILGLGRKQALFNSPVPDFCFVMTI